MVGTPFLTDANGLYVFGSGSNLRNGANPAYAPSDFLTFYPQFGTDAIGNTIVPAAVIQAYIDEATASLNIRRYRSAWQRAMGLFVAHLCTLYAQAYVDPLNGAQAVAEGGRAQGVTTSQSVGDVSESVDVGNVTDPAWGDFNLTSYGQQLIRLGKLYGKGGVQVW